MRAGTGSVTSTQDHPVNSCARNGRSGSCFRALEARKSSFADAVHLWFACYCIPRLCNAKGAKGAKVGFDPAYCTLCII